MTSVEMATPGGDWVHRLRFWHVAVLFLVLSGLGLNSVPLFEPDEGRYAEIPREMLESGDFVTPHLNGVLYFEKPVLYYWMTAASLRIFGEDEIAVRLPSLVAGLLGLLLTFFLGRSLGGHRVSAYAVLALGTSPMWIVFSRINSIDMTLSTLVTATLACFWWAHRRHEGSGWAWHAVFAASALAVLTKGLIGLVLPGGVIFFYLLLTRGWRVLTRVPWISGTLVFLVIALPWHVLVALRNPDFLWFYFVREHFLRYTTNIHDRSHPIWYFLPVVIVGLLPWSGFLPAAGRLFGRSGGAARRPALVFLGVWAGFIFLFFSASSSKLVPYILPGLPPMALLCALVVTDAEECGRSRAAAGWGLAASVLLLLSLLAAFFWLSTGHGESLLKSLPASHPALAPAALVGMALALDVLYRLWRGFSPYGSLVLVSIALGTCLILAGDSVADVRTAKPLAECLDRQPAAPDIFIASYRTYPQTLPFYLGRKIDVAEFSGELVFGISKLPPAERQRRYPTAAELKERWNSEALTYLVVERRWMDMMEPDSLRPGTVLLEQRKFLLLVNQPPEESGAVRCANGPPKAEH